MIILFEPSIEELEACPDNSLDYLLDELVYASLHGRHLVVISRRACLWALENVSLSDRQKAKISSLREKYTQYSGIKDYAPCFIEVSIGSVGLTELSTGKYTIGHVNLLNTKILSSSQFIVENAETDADFYRLILSSVAKKNEIRNIDFEIVNGGGSTTASNFKRLISERRVIVCLTDSDRDSPHCIPSDTFKGADREAKKQTFVGTLECTECREAENYIPLKVYDDSGLLNDAVMARTIEALIKDQNLDDNKDCMWFYFDLKGGYCSEKIQLKNGEKLREWCVGKYPSKDGELETCSIQGFGKSILSNFLQSHTAIRDFVKYMKTREWNDLFYEFFHKIYWYFVSERKTALV